MAKSIADEVIATGKVTHAFCGLRTIPIPPAAAAQAGLPAGLYVQAVTAGGPAAAAGITQGDAITTIDGEPASGNLQLEELTLIKNPATQCLSLSHKGIPRQIDPKMWCQRALDFPHLAPLSGRMGFVQQPRLSATCG